MHKLRKLIALLGVVAISSTLVVSTATAAEWYEPYMQNLVDVGVDFGSPGSNATRCEWTQGVVAWNGLEADAPAEPTFLDVPMTHECFEAVEAAYAHGVVSGYSNSEGEPTGYFGPGDSVTREQAAKLTVEGEDLPVIEDSGIFPDGSSFSSWATDAWYPSTVYAWNKMVGDSDTGMFRPGDNINHAEAAKVITIPAELNAAYVEGEEEPDEVVSEGDLLVELSDDTPVGDTVPCRSTSVEVAKWDFTAQDGDVILDLVRVHTHGVTSLQSGHALYLYDGADRLTSGKSVNSSTNLINFTNLNLTIDDGETVTLTLKIDISASTTTCVSAEMGFEIAEVAHIDASDAEVAGDFPLQSDTFGISTTNAGILTIEKNGTIANAKVGEDDVVVAKFKMSAATEAAEIEQLGLLITGTISNDAIENMELYVSGETDPLATTASLNSKDLAVFVLDTPYVITKGDTKAFTMKADFNTGRSADTVLIYVDETTDVLSIGATYGFGMAVDINNSSGYDGTTGGACSSATNDTCSYSALEGGDVTISSSGPTASDIGTAADDVHLLDFSIVSVSDITFKNFPISLTGSGDGTDITEGLLNATASNFTDIKIVNVDTGETLMGPIDANVMVTASAGATVITEADGDEAISYYRFSDEFDMEIGEELNLAITCDVANTATLDGMTLVATLDLGATYPQIKDINNKTVTNATSLVPASTITGKTMTVATPSLELALAAVPVSTTHIKGEAGVKFTGISAKCGAASACKITDVLLQGYIDDDDADLWSITGTAASHSTVINEIVGSVWLEDSAGGVVAAAQSVESDGDAAFNNMTWVLDAGETTIFYIVGNISSDAYKDTNPEHIAFGVATAGDVDYEDDDGNTRDSTGTPNSEGTGATTPSTYVSISEGGSLTVAVDASTPKEDIVVAGSTDVAVSEFKFTTTDEAFMVKKLSVNARQANAGTVADINDADLGAYDNNVSSITISYLNSDGDTETKEGFLTNGTATFGGMDFYIEKDDDATLTIYADVNSISGQAQVGEFVDLNIAFNDFEAIAQSSGETYKTSKIDADVAAASDLDFGTMTWIDSTCQTLAAPSTVSIGSTATMTTADSAGTADCEMIFPVGTLLCTDTGATACATDEIFVVTSSTTDGSVSDTLTVMLLDNATADTTTAKMYATDDNILFALPGTGYLTGSHHMHVYEAKPEISLSASSPSGSRSVGAADNAFVFDIEETGGLDKVQIRAGSEQGDTIVQGVNAGGDICAILTDSSAGNHIDGTAAECTIQNDTAGDSFAWDTSAVALSDYTRVNFWIQIEGAAPNFADLKVATSATQDPGDIDLDDGNATVQADPLSQTICGADAATAATTEWYNCDLAVPTGTATGDWFHIEIHDSDILGNGNIIYVDELKFYNDKLTVDIATDTDLDTYLNNTSNAGAPSEVLLKEGGSTVATAYWDTLTNGASATTTAKAVFIPTTAIEVSKGTSKTFTVQADTSDLIAEDSGEADPVTFSIDLGTSVAGTVTAGDIWWNETNFANATAGGVPGTSFAVATPGIVKWLGQVTNTTLSSNTVNY